MANVIDKLTVEAVSLKFAGGFKSGETWYSGDKQGGPGLPEFATLKSGMVLEVDHNGKWVKSFKILSEGSAVPAREYKKSDAPSGAYQASEKDAQIARAVAMKTVFESPVLANAFKDFDLSQAVSEAKGVALEITSYILTGDFKPKA